MKLSIAQWKVFFKRSHIYELTKRAAKFENRQSLVFVGTNVGLEGQGCVTKLAYCTGVLNLFGRADVSLKGRGLTQRFSYKNWFSFYFYKKW